MPDYQRLPLFPLNTVLFPGLLLPLRIFEPRYILLLKHCIETRSSFGVVMIREGAETGPGPVDFAHVGTTARITRCEKENDDSYLIEVEGETRFIIDETFDDFPYLTARVTPFWEQTAEPLDLQPLYDQTVTLFKNYLSDLLANEKRHLANLQMPLDPVLMSFAVAASIQTADSIKQSLLELAATSERLQLEIEIMRVKTHDKRDQTASEPAGSRKFIPLELLDYVNKPSRN